MFKKILSTALCIAMLSCFNLCAYAESSMSFYVDCNAESSGNGSFEAPFQSILEARDALRTLKKENAYPANGVTVYIGGGNYSPITLTSEDSGIEGGAVTYTAYNNEDVSILGGAKINFSDFSVSNDTRIPTELQGKIYSYSLKDNNIADYGGLGVTGHSRYYLQQAGWGAPYADVPNPTVLFNDSSMTLARYPNEGYMYISSVVNAGSVANRVGMEFTVDNERLSNWANAGEPWVFGLWGFDWSDLTTPVESINLETNSIKTTYASPYAPKKGRPFYIYNMLEELDVPGEWFYDMDNGELYIYPLTNEGNEKITLGFQQTTLLNMSGVSYVNVDNLNFKASRGLGVSLSNCENVSITNCDISDVSRGASLNGKNNLIDNCKIKSTGERGIFIMGGVLSEKAGNTVSNCEIYDVGKSTKMYTPGIQIQGASHTVKGNKIYDCPQMGIIFSGNLHLIENNEIYDVMKESTDGGAIYSGQTYTNWGNTIKGNTIHDVRHEKGGAHGVYLDDCVSGITVSDNRFYNIGSAAMFNHGGRSNEFLNNIIENTPTGISYSGFMGTTEPRDVWDFVSEADINNELYRELFGERFYNIPNDDPVEAKYGIVKGNICINVNTPLGVSKGYRNKTLKWIYENNDLEQPLQGYYENSEIKTEKMSQNVQATSPYDGAKASVYHKEIYIKFVYPVAEVSVTNDNIKVYEDEKLTGYSVSLTDDAKYIKISLTDGLKENSSYKVVVNKDIASYVGVNSLNNDFEFDFTVKPEEFLYFEDFENATEGDDCSKLAFTITADDSVCATVENHSKENTKALRIENGSEEIIDFTKSFSEFTIPTSGIVEVSFDVYFENRTRNFFSFANLGNYASCYASTGTSFVTYASNYPDCKVTMNNGQYYTHKYVIDLDNKTMDKYVDDVYLNTLPAGSNPLQYLQFQMRTTVYQANYGNNYKCTCKTTTGEHTEGCNLVTPMVFWLDNITVKTLEREQQELVKTTPANNDTVWTFSPISAEFKEAVFSTNATTDNITVKKDGVALDKSAYTISFPKSWDYQNKGTTVFYDYNTVNINVIGGLEGYSTYEVIISKNVTGLLEDTAFSFTTRDGNVIYYEDFEGANAGDSGSTLGYSAEMGLTATVANNSAGTNALKIEHKSGEATLKKDFSNLSIPETGTVEVSFDVYFENRTRNFYNFANLGDESACHVSNGNSFETYSSDYAKCSFTAENGKYYNYKCVINMDKKTIDKYFNGEYLGNVPSGDAPLQYLQFEISDSDISSEIGRTLADNSKCSCLLGGFLGHRDNCPKNIPMVFWLDNIKISTFEIYANVVDSETGLDISSLNDYEGKNVMVKTGIEADDAEGKTVIIAVKNEEDLLKSVYTITSAELTAGTNSKEVTIPTSEKENYKIEIYFWDELAGMKPLTSQKLVKK